MKTFFSIVSLSLFFALAASAQPYSSFNFPVVFGEFVIDKSLVKGKFNPKSLEQYIKKNLVVRFRKTKNGKGVKPKDFKIKFRSHTMSNVLVTSYSMSGSGDERSTEEFNYVDVFLRQEIIEPKELHFKSRAVKIEFKTQGGKKQFKLKNGKSPKIKFIAKPVGVNPIKKSN